MTLATRDVNILDPLPAGTNIIGEFGIDPTANEISISQTTTENKVQLSNTPGENDVVVTSGTIMVSNLPGASTNEENTVTTAIVIKNDAGAQIAPTAFFADALTKVKLDEVAITSRVGMTVEIYKDDGTVQTLIDTLFISGDGGMQEQQYTDVAKNYILTTAGGDDRFYASFINNDKTKDAFGYALFKFTITA